MAIGDEENDRAMLEVAVEIQLASGKRKSRTSKNRQIHH